MRKRLRELKKKYPRAEISVTGGNHYKLRFPDGRTGIASGTPSCTRAEKNLQKDIKKSKNST